jgi:hypothetical protein
MDRWLKCGSLKRKTDDNPSRFSVDENFTSEDKVHSLKKSRKYCPSYLQMGLSVLNKDSEARPQCVLCPEVLVNESMKPSKLRRHLETKNGESVNKPTESFENKELQLRGSQNLVKDVCGTEAVLASYEFALLMARNGQPLQLGKI